MAERQQDSWLKNLRYIAMTTLLFYMAGRLSFPLTWSQNYAGAVWPPAGIELGAVLLWGYAMLPGIYLAELLLHYEAFFVADTALKQVVFFLAPLSSVLRVWLATVLVRRYAGFPNTLISIRAILLFFLCACPVATFLPALLSVIALRANGIILESNFLFTFLTWWVGDCSGIAIFTPLFFIVFNKSHRIWRQRLFSLGLPLMVIFSIVAMGYLYAQNKEFGRLQNLVSNQTGAVKDALLDEYSIHVSVLGRIKDVVALNPFNETYFRFSAQTALTQHPDLVGIEWLSAQKINQGYRFNRQIFETRQFGRPVNFYSIPKLLSTLNIAQGSIALLGKQHYLIAVPNYEMGLNTCQCMTGVVVGVFDIKAFLYDAMHRGNYRQIVVKLMDDVSNPQVESVFGMNDDEDMADRFGLAKWETIKLGNKDWYLQVMPKPIFLSENYSWSPWQLLIGGMFLTGVMSIGLLALTGHTEFVADQVDKRTQELKRSNIKLAAREQQFRKLVQTQSAIVWRADPVTFRFVFVSAEAASILGYPVKQWLDEPDFWQKHLHEDDKENVLNLCARGSISTHNQNFDQEYRMIAEDGHIVWLRDISTLVVESGVITELYGFMIDITRQKHSEEQLRLAANTFESQQGIMITDKEAKILRVNKAFTQITGFSAVQVIGDNPRILKSGRHDQAFFEDYWRQLLTNDKFEGEIWNRRKNGEVYPEWQTVTAVRNNQGEVSHYVSVFSDITEKKDAENKIHNMAFYDPLTNLPNRRLLLDRFDHEIAIAKRYKQFGSVLYLDLDHFKILNDSQGHLVGDELLIQVAARLSEVLREEDTPARLGGDEFVVLLHANSESLSAAADHAMTVAEKIREQINAPFVLGQYQHQIGTSIGIALFPGDQESPDGVLQQADTAMYRSKSSGRNAINFFQPSMQEAADLRLSLEQDLRGAIDKGRFILCYHPQMDIKGEIVGAEALIRWEDSLKGRLSPADFIPVAEESNLILTIGKWVLMEACNQIKMWQDDGLAVLPYVSINVSSRQFRQQDFVDQVKYALESTGIAPSRLGIELTESVMIVDTNDTVDKMKALKALGVSIAVDDFGTGYSSLVYLKQLPLDVLKIDRGFVRDILSDSSDAVIVETIISMAKHLNIKVIAEGVETLEQLVFLKEKGCTIFQGYYFDEPLTAANFAETYLKQEL
ncbi:putative diguanylate cyclase [Methyloglobulus morosus KoM1]|uniref:Putative diguanylate cyclase n=1 Tax=Methyloglobulus morosus KoM1 TaxID=1116472 RepID=V5C1L9_9GAMM|nr:EAL domain-containing protein [Methyloglobulus morosus]ESS74004.1 putative diguanylate cyclase [Methyloglobulus morosus KoM1]